MSAVLILIAVVLFVLDSAGKTDIAGLTTVSLGLAFFAASFLVGPATALVRRSQ